jgi:hypothetical protein
MTTTYYLTEKELKKISKNPFLKDKILNCRVVIVKQKYRKKEKLDYWK